MNFLHGVIKRPYEGLNYFLVGEVLYTQGGGGSLIFSSFVGSGPASTVHPKNLRIFKLPKNI